MKKNLIIFLICSACISILTSCTATTSNTLSTTPSSSTTYSQTPSATTLITSASTTESPLNNTSWSLDDFENGSNVTPLLPGPEITLQFSNNSTYYSGSIGMFSYGGQMLVLGYNVSIGVMTSTAIEITDNPQGFRQQALDYLDLFRNAETYANINGQLTINCGNEKSLIFSQK